MKRDADSAAATAARPAFSVTGAGRSDPRRRRLAVALSVAAALLSLAGLTIGSDGWNWPAFVTDWHGDQAWLLLGQIRAPRTLGALAVGALLGLAGAVAQGLFRNPLADPYLLGPAAGAGLAVVIVLAASALGGTVLPLASAQSLARLGIVLAAFIGALGGVLLTLAIAQGTRQALRLLLAGVVVGVVLGALSDLIATMSPEALRGRQSFMLGSTGYLGWGSVAVLGAGLVVVVPLALRFSRLLDALTLGEDSAASLGLNPPLTRAYLVLLLALCTGLAVSQAGLVAFVGLVAPHIVRRCAPAPGGYTLAASAATGGVLLLGADILARLLVAPQELPVGVVTAVLGGSYLMWLLHGRGIPS